MRRLTRIAVGVDFSTHSGSALMRALRVAQWSGAALHVVHVIEPSLTNNLAEAYGIPYLERWDDLRRITEERLRRVLSVARESAASAPRAGAFEPRVDVDVHFGNPFVHLLREVRDVGAQLLVLGAKGASDRSNRLGHVAVQCLHKAPERVLLVNTSGDAPVRRILAGVALSETCRPLIGQAIRLAHETGAALCVVHVAGGRGPAGAEAATGASPRAQRDSEQELDRSLRELMPPLAANTRGIELKILHADDGDCRRALTEFARSWSPDLVVLGTRGRPGFTGIPEKTTAERIIQEVPCSVLAIKPPGFVYDVGGSCRLWQRQAPAGAAGTAGRRP